MLERIRAITHTSSLPKSLWGEALRHATWLKNRTAMRVLDGKTPFKALYGRLPNLSALHMWGFLVLVHSTDGSKLHAQACEACWIGLDVDTKAHRVYWPGLGNVTAEQNVYFGTSAQLKWEEDDLPAEGPKPTVTPSSPSTLPILDTPSMASTSTSASIYVNQPNAPNIPLIST